jgi:molecular chaperone DnaK (HSP70)
MDLDLDGILKVTATEKRTGLAKQITIEGATTAMSEADMAQARRRMQELFGDEESTYDEWEDAESDTIDLEAAAFSVETSSTDADRDRRVQISEARALLERSRRLLDRMTPEDREEAIDLHEQIEQALQSGPASSLQEAMATLADLLFYVEEA